MTPSPTPAMREPTKAERETARRVIDRCDADWSDAEQHIAEALAAASASAKERAAQLAESHVHKFSGLQIAAAIRAL